MDSLIPCHCKPFDLAQDRLHEAISLAFFGDCHVVRHRRTPRNDLFFAALQHFKKGLLGFYYLWGQRNSPTQVLRQQEYLGCSLH